MKPVRFLAMALFLLGTVPVLACPPASPAEPRVGRVPKGLDPFYRQAIVVRGIPVVASGKVCERALQIAAAIVAEELSGPMGKEIAANLVRHKTMVAIYADTKGEHPDSLPEEKKFKQIQPQPCGGGAIPGTPVAFSCESNLLSGDPEYRAKDPFAGEENTLVHEFGHTIENLGLIYPPPMIRHDKDYIAPGKGKGPDLWRRVQVAYQHALQYGEDHPGQRNPFLTAAGQPSYMISNDMEFFAESTQIWFRAGGPSNPANSPYLFERAHLRQYMPELYAIMAAIYPDDAWVLPRK